MAKRVLILGGGGFIGSNLLKMFDKLEGYQVFTTLHKYNPKVTTKNIGFYKADLTDRANVDRLFNLTRPDIVIHAAAVTTGAKDTLERPYIHVTDNVMANALVLEHCYKYKVDHTIFFSCTVMYQPKDAPQKEGDWKPGDEIYGTYFGVGNMKVFTEKLCDFYSRLEGAGKFTAIRHSNVYGPYDKFELDKCHMLPAMVKKVVDAKDTLEVWGEGKACRDLIYVDDLLDFVMKALEYQKSQYQLFNCGGGKAYSIQEILDTLQEICGKTLEISYNTSKPDIPTTVVLDCTKAKERLKWEPTTTLEDGLKATVKYYEQTRA